MARNAALVGSARCVFSRLKTRSRRARSSISDAGSSEVLRRQPTKIQETVMESVELSRSIRCITAICVCSHMSARL